MTSAKQPGRIAPQDIGRSIPLRGVMESLGVSTRGKNRANCPLCSGHSKNTLSFNRRFWHCFRCGQGGDAYTLVQLIQNCDFKTALRFVAALAGISLQSTNESNFRRTLAARKRKHDRVEVAIRKLLTVERQMRLAIREEIHSLERAQSLASQRLSEINQGLPEKQQGEAERCWEVLERTLPQLRRAVATYYILAFAAAAERAHYILRPKEREAMVEKVMETGCVHDSDGRRVEVYFD